MPTTILQRKRYRAVDNKWMFRDARLVDGAYYDSQEGWIEAKNREVPADTLIKSGSVFEIAASKSRERVWFLEGTVAPFEKALHFDLEDAFAPEQVMKLNVYGIFTWEDIATELDVIVPGSEFKAPNAQPSTKPLRDLLLTLCGNDPRQVQDWIARAKQKAKEA